MNDATKQPFGTVFAPKMSIATFDKEWSSVRIVKSDNLTLHPGAHVFHYASSCFEGLKAYKLPNGDIGIFRLDRHIARMQKSASALSLPIPPGELLEELIIEALRAQREFVPDTPTAMYIRPTLIGTEAAIGKAAAPSATASLYALLSIVGDYFTGSGDGLTLLMEDRYGRTAQGMGSAKAGANYASALNLILTSREQYPDISQVLFSPNGQVQETGAANFFLISENEVITGALDDSFLHGVTRDSILVLAKDLGYEVTEKNITPEDVIKWSQDGREAALSGTAAVLSPIKTIIFNDKRYDFSTGKENNHTSRLRHHLQQIQFGQSEDVHNWRKII